MTVPTPGRLEFTDCLGCGKRVATTAPLCRHCYTKRSIATDGTFTKLTPTSAPDHADHGDDDADSHAAFGFGGYGNDDFDDELNSNTPSSKQRSLWWYVALVLLIVFTITAFLPWF